MSSPPIFTSRRYIREPSSSKGVVLGVGRRAIVRNRLEATAHVPLANEDGVAVLARLEDGSEVEVTAWRPRRSAGALYRVRATAGETEGWVDAASLDAMPEKRERRVPPPAPSAARTKTTRTKTTPARATAAKATAAKATPAKATPAKTAPTKTTPTKAAHRVPSRTR